MKYLVMEVHPAYAVLLDEEGRFLKAANRHYRVGETVRDAVLLREGPARPDKRRLARPLAALAGLAACLCLVFFGWYQPNFTAYGILRIQINPDVALTVSRSERVLALEGLNPDGQDLIEGYDYRGKSRDQVTEELLERAIGMGYLSSGDTVSITVTSGDTAWQEQKASLIQEQLADRYGETIVIRIGGGDDGQQEEAGSSSGQTAEDHTEVVIPLTPPDTAAPPQDSGLGTDYGESDYGEIGHGAGDDSPAGNDTADDGDDGPDAEDDGDDTDYGPGDDGDTDYEETDDGGSDYEAANDGLWPGGSTDLSGGDDDEDDDGDEDRDG